MIHPSQIYVSHSKASRNLYSFLIEALGYE